MRAAAIDSLCAGDPWREGPESLGPHIDYDQLNFCRALIQARLRESEFQ